MDKTIEQIKRAHQGDKTAREALVKDNLGLVWSIVRRFAGRGCETEDLFQIGSIGLLKAIDKFDLSYEVRFSTYAVPMIAGEIKRFLRDDGIIKAPGRTGCALHGAWAGADAGRAGGADWSEL